MDIICGRDPLTKTKRSIQLVSGEPRTIIVGRSCLRKIDSTTDAAQIIKSIIYQGKINQEKLEVCRNPKRRSLSSSFIVFVFC